MSLSESRSGLVMELAEEFLDRYRRGERPPLKEYMERHPELAAEIREVFPAMAMMERIAIADESLAGDETQPASGTAPAPEQLGDYRIIREVGHGGMGVVYEAEQVSLGRHVALKVLPAQMLRDGKQRRRFERESRAAAKLHHTNIVPVFGVGEHEGTPYYVMQFIQGLGLDAVLDELKRLKAQSPELVGQDKLSSFPSTVPAERDLSVANLAHSLLTGRFEGAGQTDDEGEVRETVGPNEGAKLARTEFESGSRPDRVKGRPNQSATGPIEVSKAGADGTQSPTCESQTARSGLPHSSSSISILAQSNIDARGKPKKQSYWQGVARIGLQVADALAYAHQQGIVHRDVKPSNLLLDNRGTVWVTDFGLAKADDQQNLTHTGDILGTLRYIPPEAFEGKSDVRGDVYSLGLTLYELLGFRPAFDEKDRGRLVKQVTTEAPARLRAINPEVPRDLETIVHKSIERQPSHRYASAADLAGDLQRFLDDVPIRARRITPAEHFVRWCRRNPGIASLAASLLVLLVATTIGALVKERQMRRLALQERQSAVRADDERRAAEGATLAANAATVQAESQRQRAEANFAQARGAVDDYLSKVTESQLLTAPGLQSLRRDLLSSALKFYDDFLKERRDDPSIRASQARVYLKVASIQSELGQRKESKDAVDTAKRIFEGLAKERPADQEIEQGLMEAVFYAGDFRRAIDLGEGLLRKNPNKRETRETLADAHNNRNVELSNVGDYVGAMAALGRSSSLMESLSAEDPGNAKYEFRLSLAVNNMGAILANIGRSLDELPMYRRALIRCRRALAKQPNSVDYGRSVLKYLRNVQSQEESLGLQEPSSQTKTEALELSRKLAAANPGVPVFLSSRFDFAFGTGNSLIAEGKFLEALPLFQEALQLAQTPGIRESDDVVLRLPIIAAQIATIMEQMKAADLVESGRARRKEMADLAIKQLKFALDSGVTYNVRFLKESPAMKILRDREDFKALVARAEKASASNLANPGDATAQRKARAASAKTEVAPSATDRAVKLDRELLARGDAAAVHFATGLAQLQFRQYDDANRSLEVALKEREKLAAAEPDNLQAKLDLGTTHVYLGDVAHRTQKFVRAFKERKAGYDLTASVLEHASENDAIAGEAALKLNDGAHELMRNCCWDEAALRFKQATGRSTPIKKWNVQAEGLVALVRNDREHYRFVCKRYVEHYETSEFWEPLVDIAMLCSVAPDSGIDPAVVVRLGERGMNLVNLELDHYPHVYLAAAYYRSGQWGKVLEQLDLYEPKAAFGLDGDDALKGVAQTLRAMAFHRLGRKDEATKCLKRAQEMQAFLGLRAVSWQFDEQGVWMWAWAQFRMLIMEAEGLIDGHETRLNPWHTMLEARAAAQYGLTEKARALLTNPLVLDPNDTALLAARGQVLLYLGDEAQGRAIMDEVLKRDPSNLLATLWKGKSFLAAANPKDAAEVLIRPLDKMPCKGDPDDDRAQYDMLLASSEIAFRRATELRPNDIYLWIGRARMLAWLGRWKEAADAYEHGTKSGRYSNAWVEYGCVLALIGDHKRYQSLCKQIDESKIKADIQPATREYHIRHMSEVTRLAVLLPNSGIDPKVASRWAAEALDFQSNVTWYRYTSAVCRLREHKPQEAINLLTSALARDPMWTGAPLLCCTLARAHLELGKFDEASRWLERGEAAITQDEKNAKVRAFEFPVKIWVIDYLESQVQRKLARALLDSKKSADAKTRPPAA